VAPAPEQAQNGFREILKALNKAIGLLINFFVLSYQTTLIIL
jgi:hypothetical protein